MGMCLHSKAKDSGNQCYKTVADLFLSEFKFSNLLQILKDNETYPEIFARCHEVTHYIGRRAYELEKNIPKLYGQGNSACWGGFYHGVIEAYFKEKNLPIDNPESPRIISSIQNVCGKIADYLTPRFFYECLHGIGHAMMFITISDLPKSLKLCDALDKDLAHVCYQGVFMENSSSSTNINHPSEYIKAGDPMYPCDILDKQYLETCYRYQSSYFGTLTHWDWAKVAQLCEQTPQQYQSACFNTMGSNQVGAKQDYKAMEAGCAVVKNDRHYSDCTAGILDGLGGRYIGNFSKVSGFCMLVQRGTQPTCFRRLGIVVTVWSSDPLAKIKLCDSLTTEDQKAWCKGS